jgi:hypothetical protein
VFILGADRRLQRFFLLGRHLAAHRREHRLVAGLVVDLRLAALGPRLWARLQLEQHPELHDWLLCPVTTITWE